MNILAIDSSTKTASVSVQNGSNTINENVLNEITHSEKLLPLVDFVLTKSHLTLKDIDLLACTKGPGSFTGIRIGIATVKALSHVTGIPIFSISTLLLIAYIEYLEYSSLNDISEKEIYLCPAIDAKNDRIYFAIYKFTKNPLTQKINVSEVYSPTNYIIKDAMDNIQDLMQDHDIVFALDNVSQLKNKIYEYCLNLNIKESKIAFSNEDISPDSKYIIDYINQVENPNDYIVDYIKFDAVYARVSQAERINNEK